ncbi:MAG: hypothetical protein GX221_10015 [Candidatus Riflebacteria bacterium]|nr:hypothetical protein [Candidatus Riflebacteria bacterium]
MEINETHIYFIEELVENYAGVLLERLGNRRKIAKKISEQMRLFNIDLPSEYIHKLENYKEEQACMKSLVESLTVGESYFFRNLSQFEYLYKQILPEFVRLHGLSRPCKIWSLGCSTGEEAYSLAIILKAFQSRNVAFDFDLRACDISNKSLEAAKNAEYTQRSFRIPLEEIENALGFAVSRYGLYHTEFKPSRTLLNAVKYDYLNLKDLDSLHILKYSDIIFCRNVLIYFDSDLRDALAEKFYDSLFPSGSLFLGETESLSNGSAQGFDLNNMKNSYIYKKADIQGDKCGKNI